MINGDNFYGGDAAMWKKFANSMRLRIANRIKGVHADAAGEMTAAVTAGVLHQMMITQVYIMKTMQ